MKMNLGFYQILRLTYTGAESLRHEGKKRIENLSKGGRLKTYLFA